MAHIALNVIFSGEMEKRSVYSKFHANFKNASKFAILMYFRRNPSSCFYILTFIAPPFQQNHF